MSEGFQKSGMRRPVRDELWTLMHMPILTTKTIGSTKLDVRFAVSRFKINLYQCYNRKNRL